MAFSIQSIWELVSIKMISNDLYDVMCIKLIISSNITSIWSINCEKHLSYVLIDNKAKI